MQIQLMAVTRDKDVSVIHSHITSFETHFTEWTS